jgi:hypothetical protein
MNRPLISVLHPTRRVTPNEQFPRGYKAALDMWHERADSRNFEYIVAVHESRWEEFLKGIMPLPGGDGLYIFTPEPDGMDGQVVYPFRIVKNTKRDCMVDQTNCAFEASTGLLLTGAADDYYPPEHWDTLLLEARAAYRMGDRKMDAPPLLEEDECVILCSTGATPERDRELMIGGAVTRKVIERRGYCLDPDFESMWSDNWWAFENRRDEKAGLLRIIERLDIQFDHRHPIFGKGQMDEHYAQQNRAEAYKLGELTFIHKVTGKPIVIVCMPGELFRSNWVQMSFNTLFGMANDCLPVPFQNYSSNVYMTRMEMAQKALEFRPKAQFVLWWDDDNEVSLEHVNTLARDLKEHPELDIVVGYSWCDNHAEKGHDVNEWSLSCGRQRWSDLQCNRFRGPDIQKALKGNGLITSDDIQPHVFWSGFPLVLMRRSALEKVGWEAFRARTTDPELLAALKYLLSASKAVGLAPKQFVYDAIDRAEVIASCKFGQTSEDTSFFMACHEKGLKCAVDVRVKVPHIKPRAIEPQFIPASQVEQMNIGKTSLKFGPLNLLGSDEEQPVEASAAD